MPRSTRRRLPVAVLALLATALPAHAATPVVIYRCTDTSGALTVQNDEPCPAGSRQERTVVEPPPPMPVYVPQSPTPAPGPAPTAAPEEPQAQAPERPHAPAPARIADTDRLPPPPIFRCHTPGNDRYVSEDAEPQPRCVPLQTVGINGDPNLGAGAACEWQYDRCERIPDGEACDGWRQRGREIESTWRYARGDARAPLQQEFARVSTILSDTTCGLAQPR
ncbi:MAG TPA: DUF4124 domain-containing protein [Luteimonas sp.]